MWRWIVVDYRLPPTLHAAPAVAWLQVSRWLMSSGRIDSAAWPRGRGSRGDQGQKEKETKLDHASPLLYIKTSCV